MSNSNEMFAPKQIKLLFLLTIFVTIQHEANSSGIFELNLSALMDAYGRDLRQDCCAWQNSSLDKQQAGAGMNPIQSTNSVSSGRYAAESCDPTKCQLIIRICVKNYQTQIDPSQCTFGELTAQVMRPDERHHHNSNNNNNNHQHHHHASHMLSVARLQQQQQLASYQKMKFTNGNMLNGNQQPTNIHHQRMLLQQLQQASYLTMDPSSSEQHARLFHQSGSQARSLRQIAFDQPISFPFNFTWPGAFALVIDAWYESPTGLQQLAGGSFAANAYQGRLYQQPPAAHYAHQLAQQQQQLVTSYDLYKKQLIIQHSMHGWLTVKNEWTSGIHKTDAAQLVYAYRVTCQPNYYGEQCNILCRPRDDVYGHSLCSEQGDVVCLPGWQGKYCEDPICAAGCQNCTRPNECNCLYGWQGPTCEQCVRYPGCVHGTCAKPHDCNCEEGWGGLLCNEDLRYCTNHQPCRNGATCRNIFNNKTGEGTYACVCQEGFEGKNCELHAHDLMSSNQHAVLTTTSHSSSLGQQPIQNSPLQSPMISTPTSQPSSRAKEPTGNKLPLVKPTPMQHWPIQPPPTTTTNNNRDPQPSPVTQIVSPSPSLDHRVMVAYGIIIVCMVILVVLLLLRFFFERLSGAVVGCGQRLVSSGSDGTIWSMITSSSSATGNSGQHEPMDRRRSSSSSRRHRHHHHHHRHLHHQSTRSLGLGAAGGPEQDVAILQNHQNIYKSRSSLSTDKMAMVYGTNETCSSASSSVSSSSSTTTSAEDLANHHAALQSQYSASAHYAPAGGHYAPASHHYHHNPLHAHPPPHNIYGSVGANHHHHHHLPLPPVHHHHPHDPYHAMSAHSVHNLSSANYQHLNQRLSQQPPPPPYTISGNMMSSQRQSSAAPGNSIYNSHSTTYAPAGSIYDANYGPHPAGLILGLAPPPPASIYNSDEATYGTAAALAAHCVSTGIYSLGRGLAASATTLPMGSQTQDCSPQKSKLNPNKSQSLSVSKPKPKQQSQNQAQNCERDETTNVSSETNTSNNPYGNLQQPVAASRVENEPESDQTNETTNLPQSQQANFFTFDHD